MYLSNFYIFIFPLIKNIFISLKLKTEKKFHHLNVNSILYLNYKCTSKIFFFMNLFLI